MNKEALLRYTALITWCASPDSPQEIHRILAAFPTDELAAIAVVAADGSAAGRVAWAEYARRKKFLDFTFQITVLKDAVLLSVEAEARPAHEGVTFGLRGKT